MAKAGNRNGVGLSSAERRELVPLRLDEVIVPQRSQPGLSRVTQQALKEADEANTPQWSQPRLGRMTETRAVPGRSCLRAAMEPTWVRSDDP